MGMPLFAASALFAPLQQFARSIARVLAAPQPQAALRAPGLGAAPARQVLPGAAAPRRLRIVCVADGAPTRSAGRMVISGRMADVCAELERLAALEAAAG